ncbi:MAG: hypothetical protein JST40_00120 [Armatimonadetes bacterium]|nr:hypothetical protein [Armatimonadota bacterium]
MESEEKNDNLVVKTHHQGHEAELTPGDQAMIELDPVGVTITRGLVNQFPGPKDPDAAHLLEQIFLAHRESDGPTILELAGRFRERYGWHPRVEWFRVLAMKIVNQPDLIAAQRALLESYERAAAGYPPTPSSPLQFEIPNETWDWAIGANYLNLMEWLWDAGKYAEAIQAFGPSLQGLTQNDDKGRWVERLLYKASSYARNGQKDEARATFEEAKSIDKTEFSRLWELMSPKMSELEQL